MYPGDGWTDDERALTDAERVHQKQKRERTREEQRDWEKEGKLETRERASGLFSFSLFWNGLMAAAKHTHTHNHTHSNRHSGPDNSPPLDILL